MAYMTIHAIPQGNNKPVNRLVGLNVRNYAALRGKSHLELAIELGVDQSSMSRRIKGTTDWAPDEMAKVARLLGVKVWRLFAELPDLDSNQEPIGFKSAPVMLDAFRAQKIAAHNTKATTSTVLPVLSSKTARALSF